MLDLGFSAINSMDVREISAPHLRQLSDETGHTVNLAILDGTDVVYIERCRTARPGQREIDLNLHVGSRLPAYCTAMGKAILAFLPEDAARGARSSDRLRPSAARTRSPSAEAFRAELGGIRASGIAVNDEELAYGLRSIAAPIHSHVGRGRRGAQPRRPPHDGLDGRADRALRPGGLANGARDLARHGTQAGAVVMLPWMTTKAKHSRTKGSGSA